MWIVIIIIAIIIIIYLVNENQNNKDSNNYKLEIKRKATTSYLNKHDEEREELTSYDDIITAYEYQANIWTPLTSLEALNHHGEIVKNVKGINLPDFGDNKRNHCIWLPIVDKYSQQKKLNPSELRDLEFLKRFRKAYESDLAFDQKFEIISSLLKEYEDLSLRIGAEDWYLWELQEIPGVSYSISDVLFFEGIRSKQDVKNTSDEKLLSISGIGPGRLKQIRAYFARELTASEMVTLNDHFQKTPTKPWSAEEKIKVKDIDISKAKKIFLPKLKYEHTPDPADLVNQDWEKYNSITLTALKYYNTRRYLLAKEEWLKIYDWYHRDQRYYTSLLRTFRKLVEDSIKKKRFSEAFEQLNELLTKCPNHTNTDIKNYNFVVTHLNNSNPDQKLELKQLLITEPDYYIDSHSIKFIQETSKPRGIKFEYSGETSVLELKSISDFLPNTLPHLYFDKTGISYTKTCSIPSIPNNTYRFRESQNLNSFLSSSKELRIHLYNWNLELLGYFDASKFAEGHTHLRRIELASDLSFFIFTVMDKAYLLDSKLNLIRAWNVPYKEGFEKRKTGSTTSENQQVKECLQILELDNNKPSQEEIKIAFRKSILKWHPDKNPDKPEAEEKTRQLIQAYEYLTGEDAQKAFDGINKESYYWVDLSKITRFEMGGMSFELIFSIGSGEDWIYGAGMSEDGRRIYLGCYSGILYQINQNGIADKIYIIPVDQVNNYPRTNPISFITEYNDRKYILTQWYLYILKDEKVMCHLKNEKGRFKWFKKGFIHQQKNQIILFDCDGSNLGSLSFKSPILLVGYKDDFLLVETTQKAFTFSLEY
ncbi:MAG: DnaJ domain-containing protein [Bacteroidales bacterium]|nr:DnaJ domain-containing protein [Bacteroidales bacterium]